ncbi:MAG: glucose-6-phosphate isomerase [Rhodocyclaceae bacterium]|nr:glucose-6-phosphate isomerase [Rhodocyclaceae bacterium]
MSTPVTQLPAWDALLQARDRLAGTHLNQLFANDPARPDARFNGLSLRLENLLFDYSKQRVTPETMELLVALAEARDMSAGIRRMAAGELINFTERRAALHIALRGPGKWQVSGHEVNSEVEGTLWRVAKFVSALRSGQVLGATGKPIRRVVNIGIGGSDLGPRMAARALAAFAGPVAVDFVANVDPTELQAVLAGAEPAETLFIASSKTFTTVETLTNAGSARDWIIAHLGEAAVPRHFAAVSNNVSTACDFGIPAERIFAMAEWVGGRYSMWSAIGLPLACAIGMEGFGELLAGAAEMDQHFLSAPLAQNMPVIMGLLGIWNADFQDASSLAVLPYCHALADLPAYLQQLEMESNGKRVLADGTPVGVHTSPILWGGPGTVGQHAYHQLMYQGTRTVATDFIVVVGDDSPAQRVLVDNALAQSAALMAGKTAETAKAELLARGISPAEAERLAPHVACPGNQPSSTLLMPHLTPRSLGRLVALYEHKVFVQGWIWGINSFDQYGVELGKQMARSIEAMRGDPSRLDASTRGLMAAVDNCRRDG